MKTRIEADQMQQKKLRSSVRSSPVGLLGSQRGYLDTPVAQPTTCQVTFFHVNSFLLLDLLYHVFQIVLTIEHQADRDLDRNSNSFELTKQIGIDPQVTLTTNARVWSNSCTRLAPNVTKPNDS